jgi:hypothetical protein
MNVTAGDAVARALAVGPDSSVAERTIDITTLGRRSGRPRRIEVWFRVITAVLDLQNRPEIAARVSQHQDLGDWLARSPLVEIVFDDEQLRTAPPAQSG